MNTVIRTESDRQLIATELDRRIAEPKASFSTVDQDWLKDYQREVRKNLHCAPIGAQVLVAPLQGWDGKPLSGRQPLGAGGLLMNAHYRRMVEEKYGETAIERARRSHRAWRWMYSKG